MVGCFDIWVPSCYGFATLGRIHFGCGWERSKPSGKGPWKPRIAPATTDQL